MSSFRDRFREAQTLRKGCRHEERVRHALLSTGSEALWQRIEGCGVGRLCNSAYCKACRERNVQTHSRRLVQLHREHHGHDEAAARANLRFVTALCELVPLDEGAIREAIGRGKRALTSIRRSFPRLLIEGRFEIEVIDVEGVFASLCPRKVTVIRSLMGDDPDRLPGQDMALVHFHAIVFLSAHDPGEVREKFAGKWPGNYRIKLDKLHHDKTTENNIRRLCSYFLKNRVRYNLRIDTKSFIDGDYISNDSLSSLVTSDVSIGINQMLIYSKGKCG